MTETKRNEYELPVIEFQKVVRKLTEISDVVQVRDGSRLLDISDLRGKIEVKFMKKSDNAKVFLTATWLFEKDFYSSHIKFLLTKNKGELKCQK